MSVSLNGLQKSREGEHGGTFEDDSEKIGCSDGGHYGLEFDGAINPKPTEAKRGKKCEASSKRYELPGNSTPALHYD
jgi:hypothetical protein